MGEEQRVADTILLEQLSGGAPSSSALERQYWTCSSTSIAAHDASLADTGRADAGAPSRTPGPDHVAGQRGTRSLPNSGSSSSGLGGAVSRLTMTRAPIEIRAAG